MDYKRFYTCNYCYKDYEPKRRGAQKYCSNTCRSKAHHSRQKLEKNVIEKPLSVETNLTLQKAKPEVMSAVGVGNAVAGVLAADLLKNFLRKDTNKPATKGDIKDLVDKLNARYHIIKNMEPNHFGQNPYVDILNNVLVYM